MKNMILLKKGMLMFSYVPVRTCNSYI